MARAYALGRGTRRDSILRLVHCRLCCERYDERVDKSTTQYEVLKLSLEGDKYNEVEDSGLMHAHDSL